MRTLVTYFMVLLVISFRAQSVKLLPDTISVCAGDSNYLEVRISLDNRAFITWDTPAGIIANTRKVKAEKEGRYLVRVSNNPPGSSQLDSSYVKIYTKPRSNIRDTSLCSGQRITLEAIRGPYAYEWSTGENNRTINIEKPGRYWVKISNRACTVVDSVRVKTVTFSQSSLPPETTFCLSEENKNLSIKVSPGTRILWNTGSTSPSIPVAREGTYWVRTQYRGCPPQTDTARVRFKGCECEMMIPNSFTPNEDGRNDQFYPFTVCEYSFYYITITDRWGNTVFSSNSLNNRWDGRFKGNLCPEDIYVYRIETIEKAGEKKQVRNGHISLFR